MQEDDTPQKESGDKVRARVLRMIKLVQEPKKFAEKDIRAGIQNDQLYFSSGTNIFSKSVLD